MKTAVIYSTKYGTTQECALILKGKLKGDVYAVSCMNMTRSLDDYDNIIIGTSLYAGKPRSEISKFCQVNREKLELKNLGIFICGFQKDPNDKKQIEAAFPLELVRAAKSLEYFGGAILYDKMNFFEKFIMKKLTKYKENTKYINDENIAKMVKIFNDLQK